MDQFLREAGLTGRKLEMAKQHLEDNLIETVQELKDLSLREKDFEKTLKQSGLRVAISKAFDSTVSANTEIESSSQTTGPTSSKTPIPTSTKIPAAVESPRTLQLPKGKIYGTFASHKKQHTVFGNDSEVSAGRCGRRDVCEICCPEYL